MPAVSEAQRRAMYAAAEGHSTLGIPQSVGEEFVEKDSAEPQSETVTELDTAKGIRDGSLESPQQFGNLWMFDVRVTGTGTSYRTQVDEYVYRPPEDFLTDDFLERCNGLPVIFGHPAGDDLTLTTDEYRQRAVGTLVLPYIKGDEVWGIAKIYDEDAATLMRTTHASTSPAVVFKKTDDTARMDAGEGETILIEGKPSYLDHLAICEEGVWDKGGKPSGIRSTEEEPAMADEATVPAYVDEIHKRLDEVVSRLDSLNKGEVEAPKEEERAAGEELAQAREEIKEEHADSAEEKKEEEVKADAKEDPKEEAKEDKKEEVKADAQARENAALKAQIKSMEDRMNRAFRPLSASDRDELARVQARGDNLAQMFGDSVNPPLAGESVIEYRKRLASKFQRHSDSTKGIKLDALDESSFGIIEERIYADAQKAAHNPDAPAEGRLVAIKSQDGAGRTITKYHGDPKAWLKPFMAKGMSIRFADSATRRGA